MASKKPPSSASKAGASRQNVRVICRIRPVNQKEIQNGGVTCVNYTDTAIEVKGEEGKNDFSFDRVFGPESTQVGVFEYAASSIITDVLAGYNATIFAYGQTGTGKVSSRRVD